MRRFWPAMALGVAAAAIAAAGCGGSDSSSSGETTTATDTSAASGAASGTLTGSVGPGFEISMAESTVAAGTYTLKVDDKASIHNFHLTGDGVDVSTDVSGTGEKTFTVTLKPGTYTFVCDPHSSQMHGTLTVT
jgi:plastocyanin